MTKLITFLANLFTPAGLISDLFAVAEAVVVETFKVAAEVIAFAFKLLREILGASTAAFGKISFADVLHAVALGLTATATAASYGSELLGLLAGGLTTLVALVNRLYSGPHKP